MDIPAVETDRRAEIVQHLATAITEVTGKQPRMAGSGPACDSWMFVMRGIPTVCGYGVQCSGVHDADEWVDIASLQKVTEVYARTILSFFA